MCRYVGEIFIIGTNSTVLCNIPEIYPNNLERTENSICNIYIIFWTPLLLFVDITTEENFFVISTCI